MGGMDDLELAEELLLDNHLFIILWQKLKRIQSQPNHLYPQISGSNPRSEIGYTYETSKPHCTNYTPLTASTSSFASSPKRLPSAKRQHGYGTPEDLQGCKWHRSGFTFCLNSIHLQQTFGLKHRNKKKQVTGKWKIILNKEYRKINKRLGRRLNLPNDRSQRRDNKCRRRWMVMEKLSENRCKIK